MQTFKLGSFDGYKKGMKFPAVYVFRSGRRIYYVGATKDFGERMKGHARGAEKGFPLPPIAEAMYKSRGAWRNWDVVVYTIEECAGIVGNVSAGLYKEALFVAEDKMINKFNPRLNVVRPKDYASWSDSLDGASSKALDAWRTGDRSFARGYAQMCLHPRTVQRTYLQDNAAERIKLAQRTFVEGWQ